MSIGGLARAVLGSRFHAVARWYRAVFVNLETVADVLAGILPANAHVLDVGGGDGEPLNSQPPMRQMLPATIIDTRWCAR